jgi:hypothetical protein
MVGQRRVAVTKRSSRSWSGDAGRLPKTVGHERRQERTRVVDRSARPRPHRATEQMARGLSTTRMRSSPSSPAPRAAADHDRAPRDSRGPSPEWQRRAGCWRRGRRARCTAMARGSVACSRERARRGLRHHARRASCSKHSGSGTRTSWGILTRAATVPSASTATALMEVVPISSPTVISPM